MQQAALRYERREARSKHLTEREFFEKTSSLIGPSKQPANPRDFQENLKDAVMRWQKFGNYQYMKAVDIAEHWTWPEPAIHKVMAGGKSVGAARTEVVSLCLAKLHGSWSVNPNEATRCASLLKRLDRCGEEGLT